MTFVSLGYTTDTAQKIIGALSGIVFIVVGILAIFVIFRGRKSRMAVICLLCILVFFFVEAMVEIILWSIAKSDCTNTSTFYHQFACGDKTSFFFALTIILLFSSAIGAAAVFALCLLFRKEDEEEHEQYVYLSGTDDTEF